MRNPRTVSINNTPVPLVSDYIHFRLHEDTENDVTTLRDYGNTGLFTNDLADIGGTTHTFSAGMFTPDGTQDGQFDSAAMVEFLRLDNLDGVGGLLVMMNVKSTAPPATGSNYILFAGKNGQAGTGGFGIAHTSTDKYQLQWRTGTSAGTQVLANIDPLDANAHTVAYYIDCMTSPATAYPYLDGILGVAAQFDEVSLPPAAARAFSLFVEQSSDAILANQMNTDSENLAISDLRIIRFEYDAYSYIAEILAEYTATPRESALRTLGGR
jgi:hypothetical protein